MRNYSSSEGGFPEEKIQFLSSHAQQELLTITVLKTVGLAKYVKTGDLIEVRSKFLLIPANTFVKVIDFDFDGTPIVTFA